MAIGSIGRTAFILLIMVSRYVLEGAFTSTPGTVSGRVGGSATLTWVYDNEADAVSVVWDFGPVNVFNYQPSTGYTLQGAAQFAGRVTHNGNASITLSSLTANDAGSYTCTVTYNSNPTVNDVATLVINHPPQGKPVMSFSTLSYLTGSTIRLSCSITEDGNPQATWTWRCGSRTFNSGITNSVGQSNLTFVLTRADDKQPCTCTASSSVGPYSQTSDPVILDIRYLPHGKPVMSYSTLTYLTGSTVTLSCSITEDGNPQAMWTWRCGSRTFSSGTTHSVGRSNLTFVVTKTDNNQPCTCTASSPVGPYSQTSDPATLDIRFETTTTTPPVPQRSDISCDADTIDTFVPISMLPSGAPLTWRDPSCKVTSNGTHMISSIGHNQCGTTVTITKDTVEFENELTAQISNHSANTLIDFGENSYVIPVKCIYPRTETPMTSYVPLQQHVRFYEKRYGHFDVDITQYDSDKFSSAIQGLGVPRKVALNTEIFVEVKMNDQFNNGLGIHVDKCIATPSPSPSDSTYYNLLTDGCPASQHVQLYNAPANKVRLGVRAFQFTSHNSSIVYIHCQTSMCEVGTPYCVSNCVTAGRRKRDVAPDQKSHLVSTGPFVFVADEQDDPIRMSTIVASVSLFVAVVACVAAVMGWTRKKTHKCTKEEGLL